MPFSTARDANRVPAIFGVSSVDLVTPTAIKVNPVTGAMLIDAASLYAGLDSRYVNVTGDTMTGALAVTQNLTLTIDSTSVDGLSVTGSQTDGTISKNSLSVDTTFSPTADTNQRLWGLRFSVASTTSRSFTSGLALTGFEGLASHNGSGTMVSAIGGLAYSRKQGAGTLTTAYGIVALGNGANTGSITTSINLGVFDGFTSSGGTIGTQYGLKIEDQTVGATNYAIFTGLGKVYHADKLQTDNRFLLGGDLSLIPIAGTQSAITSYWGLLLVGNHQGDIDYTPTAVGNRDDANVIIPTSWNNHVGLIIYGASSQSANLQEWRANGGSTALSAIDSSGRFVTPTVAGAPTGTPATGTMVYDTTNNKFYVYNGGWKSVTLT